MSPPSMLGQSRIPGRSSLQARKLADHAHQAADLAGHCPAGSEPPSPHWRVIERITTAEVLARAGDEHAAQTMLTAAISDAESLRLPHQVQRVIGLASEPGILTGRRVHQQARTALTRLERQITSTAAPAGSGAAARLPGITAGQA